MGGGCGKGRIWTQGRKLVFGNLGRGVLEKVGFGLRKEEFRNLGGVLEMVRFGLGEENWYLEIGGGGVFWKRLDLDSGKKIGIWKFGGGVLK